MLVAVEKEEEDGTGRSTRGGGFERTVMLFVEGEEKRNKGLDSS